jgi:hypothetical protein
VSGVAIVGGRASAAGEDIGENIGEDIGEDR